MSLVARTGRHRQRYDNHFRLVAGCVPYRLKQSGEYSTGSLDRLKILMISSPNRNDLVFPKGGWEDDETIDQAACREAWEEAGIKGLLHKESLGTWECRSKSSEGSHSLEGFCRIYIFALKVTEELDSWPEQASHGRRWLSVPEAWALCRYPWMCKALEECVLFLQHQNAISASDPLIREALEECVKFVRRQNAVSASNPSFAAQGPWNQNTSTPPSLPCVPTRLNYSTKSLEPERIENKINALCCRSS